MQAQFREMPEADRRRHQNELGLVIITRRPEQPPQPEKKKKMHEQTQTRGNPGSKAQQALERMSEPPTFKEVAKHELQRAAVYVPILFSAGLGLVWTSKKLFFKVG